MKPFVRPGRVWLQVASAAAALLLCGCGITTTTSSEQSPQKNDLRIENLTAHSITDSSAVLSWTTTEPTIGHVLYSADQALQTAQSRISQLSYEHEVTLSDLLPATRYYYSVTAVTTLGDTISAAGPPFTTLEDQDTHDTTPPVISDVTIAGITSSSACIQWKTDDPCRCLIYYGKTISYGQTATEHADDPSRYTRSHALTLTGLDEQSTYHFVISATNKASLSAISNDSTFITVKAPEISFCADTICADPNTGEFQLPVCIDGALDLMGAELHIRYNPTEMEMTGFEEGSFYTDNSGHLMMSPEDRPLSQGGFLKQIVVDATWEIQYDPTNTYPIGTEADGSGVICTIHARLKPTIREIQVAYIMDDDPTDQFVPEDASKLKDYNNLPITFTSKGCVVTRP